MSTWQITGQYMETCNCTLLCPCITSNLAARPTEGDCKAAVTLRIDKGAKDGIKLDGLAFVVMLHSPGAMGDGNITVGLIIDEAASDQQVEAITAIATGSAGGPMAALGPLVGRVAGVERRPIRFQANGLNYSVSAGELVDQACEGLPSAAIPVKPSASTTRRIRSIAGCPLPRRRAAASTFLASTGTTRPARATGTSRHSPGLGKAFDRIRRSWSAIRTHFTLVTT